jgi:chitodextrinase
MPGKEQSMEALPRKSPGADASSTRRLVARIASATALTVAAVGVSLVVAQPAQAVTICEQFGTVVSGNYVIMNNRWGSPGPQCINTTASGFTITQQDGMGNTSGAPASYPAIYLGCHYSNCSPNSPLPAQISSMGNVNTSINLTYPSSGTWNAAYDIWINADTNVTGVQDTEIMIWLNRQGSIQPIGSNTGNVTLAGRTWQVWVGSNGQNNVVSYLATSLPITSISFNARDFILDATTRGSNFGTTSWYLTSVQAGFEPWIGGVGLTVNSFSATVGGTVINPPGTPGTPVPSNVTSSGVTLNWAASSGTVGNYQIERATGATSTNFTQVGTSTSPSFNDSGLAANTTYRYRVRATNSGGNSAYSNITNVTTSGGTGQVPGTPGTPSTSNVTSSSLTLSWGASSGTVSNYQVERATGATSTSFTQVGTSTSTTFNDSGLAANTTYRYRVRATNSAGNSPYSAITNVTTSGGSTGGTCTYRIDSWDVGYVAYVTVNGPRSGWSIPFTMGTNNTIVNSWNATISGTGTSRTATNVSHNGNLAAGQSTQWGFQASRPAGGALPTFTGCTAQ